MPNAIQIDKLYFSYNTIQVIHAASFTVPKQGITALIGPNGSGKSTILKLILGLYVPQAGNIIADPDPKSDRNLISYSPEVYSLFKHATVIEYLMLSAQLRGMKIRESKLAGKAFLTINHRKVLLR